MKMLFSAPNLIVVSQLKDMLERDGIDCFLKNEILSGLAPEIPWTETWPELWVQNDADLSKAEAVKTDWEEAMLA
ncbi:MAG TPA: DUF2007 domain-containing protein [Verrucomicrobiae bacterium]|jgi:hypothetical protein|nr:DUF2007 domain-containing protein [Verrucomicrobiae bacterium]